MRHDEDQRGICDSQQFFHELIQNEVNAGISSDRIILGGFSQVCHMDHPPFLSNSRVFCPALLQPCRPPRGILIY